MGYMKCFLPEDPSASAAGENASATRIRGSLFMFVQLPRMASARPEVSTSLKFASGPITLSHDIGQRTETEMSQLSHSSECILWIHQEVC